MLRALRFRWQRPVLSPDEGKREVRRKDLLRALAACESRLLSINLLSAHGQVEDAEHLLRLMAPDITQLVLSCFHHPGVTDIAPDVDKLHAVADPAIHRMLEEPGFAAYLIAGDFPAEWDAQRTLGEIDRILEQLRRTPRGRRPADLSTEIPRFKKTARVRLAALAVVLALFVLGGFVVHQRSLYSVNLALGHPAIQSSTSEDAIAKLAVDGREDSDYTHGSVSSTRQEPHPWWQVDLGEVAPIRSIQVWHRSDCCADRLADFYLFVSSQPFAGQDVQASLAQAGVSAYYFGQVLPYYANPLEMGISRPGRYIRVQLTGVGPLELAEVKVWRVAGPFFSSF